MSSSQMPVWPRKVEKRPVPEGMADQAPPASSTTQSWAMASGPKSVRARASSVIDDLVRQVLEVRQLADHRHQFGDVRLDRRSDHPWRARFAAETTAPSEASRMDESRPTPHQVVPSAPAHSTYATADAPEPSVSACSE